VEIHKPREKEKRNFMKLLDGRQEEGEAGTQGA
jgi:hypothetical protein